MHIGLPVFHYYLCMPGYYIYSCSNMQSELPMMSAFKLFEDKEKQWE